MRKTLPLLALLALAASSHAGIIGTSSAITTAFFDANPNVTLSGLMGEEYDFGTPYSKDGSDDIDGGGAVGRTSASEIHSFDGTTFVAGSLTSATLLADTPGYSRYATSIGYQYDFNLTNTSLVAQTVTFHVTLLRASAASATGHIYTPDEEYGDYSDGTGFGGVYSRDTLDFGEQTTGSSTYDFDPTDSIIFGPSYSNVITITKSYTLDAGATRPFGVYASGDSYVDFTPVPEPSAFAALGLGALGLLRRRRK